MARANRKSGGGTVGRFKPKKMGKGYSTNRKVPIGSRPVLRVTEPDEEKSEKTEESKSEG